jgi:uncharacterized protein YndB with AHSA1/START domain
MAVSTSHSAQVTLPADNQIRITRVFDAPRALVYRAYTEPELVKRWFHANRAEVLSAEIDLRVGGKWRYVSRTPDGYEFTFSGEYRELVPNERIVATEVFDGTPHAEALDTVTFEEADGRTTLTMLVEHASKADRDAMLESGMEDGLQDALDLLEQVAKGL